MQEHALAVEAGIAHAKSAALRAASQVSRQFSEQGASEGLQEAVLCAMTQMHGVFASAMQGALVHGITATAALLKLREEVAAVARIEEHGETVHVRPGHGQAVKAVTPTHCAARQVPRSSTAGDTGAGLGTGGDGDDVLMQDAPAGRGGDTGGGSTRVGSGSGGHGHSSGGTRGGDGGDTHVSSGGRSASGGAVLMQQAPAPSMPSSSPQHDPLAPIDPRSFAHTQRPQHVQQHQQRFNLQQQQPRQVHQLQAQVVEPVSQIFPTRTSSGGVFPSSHGRDLSSHPSSRGPSIHGGGSGAAIAAGPAEHAAHMHATEEAALLQTHRNQQAQLSQVLAAPAPAMHAVSVDQLSEIQRQQHQLQQLQQQYKKGRIAAHSRTQQLARQTGDPATFENSRQAVVPQPTIYMLSHGGRPTIESGRVPAVQQRPQPDTLFSTDVAAMNHHHTQFAAASAAARTHAHAPTGDGPLSPRQFGASTPVGWAPPQPQQQRQQHPGALTERVVPSHTQHAQQPQQHVASGRQFQYYAEVPAGSQQHARDLQHRFSAGGQQQQQHVARQNVVSQPHVLVNQPRALVPVSSMMYAAPTQQVPAAVQGHNTPLQMPIATYLQRTAAPQQAQQQAQQHTQQQAQQQAQQHAAAGAFSSQQLHDL